MLKTRASEPETKTSFSESLGTETYRVSPGLASEGLNVMRLTVRSALIAPRTFSECEGSRLGGTAMVYIVFFFKRDIYINVMADIPDIDQTRDAGGARGGGDDDTQDLSFPGVPTKAPDEQRRGRFGDARPKTKGPYVQVPQHDKNDIPMTKMSKQQSGLPSTSKGTAETSFTEGMPQGRVKNVDSMKMELAHQRIQEQYPNYGKHGNLLTLEVVDGKLVSLGPKGGLTNLYLADGKTLNPQLLKLKKRSENPWPNKN